MPAADLLFVDTNVLLYSLDTASPEKQEQARLWVDWAWDRGVGRLSWQVINEFSANAERMSRGARITVRQAVEFFVLWDPAQPSLETIRRCWQWMDKAQVTYWDGLILAAAEQAGCVWLLSEDFQAGRTYGSVTAVNPFQKSPKDFRAGGATPGGRRGT